MTRRADYPDCLTQEDVAELLAVSPAQVYRLPIPWLRLDTRTGSGRGARRYLLEDVMEYLRRKRDAA